MENLVEIAYQTLGNMDEAREVVDFVNSEDGYLYRAPPELPKQFEALEASLANMRIAVDNMNRFYSSLKKRPIKYVFVDKTEPHRIEDDFFVRMIELLGGKK